MRGTAFLLAAVYAAFGFALAALLAALMETPLTGHARAARWFVLALLLVVSAWPLVYVLWLWR